MFFSPFSIAIIPLWEERANLSAFRTFVRFVLVWIWRFPLPLSVWERLRFVTVALPGLFSYLFCTCEYILLLEFMVTWQNSKRVSSKVHAFIQNAVNFALLYSGFCMNQYPSFRNNKTQPYSFSNVVLRFLCKIQEMRNPTIRKRFDPRFLC